MDRDLETLADLLRTTRMLALTGAGCSTRSGIPDYRGAGARVRTPVQYRDFVEDPHARRRYWARSFHGWPRFREARPNPAHDALAALETAGRLAGIVTQNVDGLHQRAGSERVVELHGALREVACLACGAREGRDDLQRRLAELNDGWDASPASSAPDGDMDLDGDAIASFRVADCLACGGMLKPRVVFFGEVVPQPSLAACAALMGDAEALLVVGSSLAVFSGFRLVREAARRGWPIAIVNVGATRGDDLAAVRLDADAAVVLPAALAAVGVRQRLDGPSATGVDSGATHQGDEAR